MELSEKHIENCKLITDRVKLLELMPKNAICAEIGIDEGFFSEKILNITNPNKFFLIDSWDSSRYNVQKEFKVREKFKDNNNVAVLKEKSLTALKCFADFYLDFAYLDTSHEYFNTYLELEMLLFKVKNNGFICGHDYTQGNIEKPLKYGVVEAVNEFCFKNNYQFIYLTNEPHRHLSFCIQKIQL